MSNLTINHFIHLFTISWMVSVANVSGAIATPTHTETIKLDKSTTKVLQVQARQPVTEKSTEVLSGNLLNRSLKEYTPDDIDLTSRGTAADLMAETVPASTPPVETPDPSPASAPTTDIPPSSDVTPAEPLSPPASESSPGQLEAKAEPDKSWEFLIEPYLFLPFNLDADVTVGGRTASVDANLSDIFSLDRIFAASLRFQARRDRFGFIFDGSYLFGREKGNQEVTIPQEVVAQFGLTTDLNIRANTTVTSRLATIDLAGFYRVLDNDLGRTETGSTTYPKLILDTYAGLRINFISLDLEIDSISINNIVLNDQDLNTSVTLFEPLVGGRIGLELSDRWTVGMRGDVSGFGINGDKNITWNFLVGTQYWLSRSTGLQLAYRFTRLVYEDGEGRDARGLDLSQNGLWLGMVFRL